MLVCAFVCIFVLSYIFQFFDCALGGAILFEFRLGMGPHGSVSIYIYCGAQTVELTASNASTFIQLDHLTPGSDLICAQIR